MNELMKAASKKYPLYCLHDDDEMVFSEKSDLWFCPKCLKTLDVNEYAILALSREIERLETELAALDKLVAQVRWDTERDVLLRVSGAWTNHNHTDLLTWINGEMNRLLTPKTEENDENIV